MQVGIEWQHLNALPMNGEVIIYADDLGDRPIQSCIVEDGRPFIVGHIFVESEARSSSSPLSGKVIKPTYWRHVPADEWRPMWSLPASGEVLVRVDDLDGRTVHACQIDRGRPGLVGHCPADMMPELQGWQPMPDAPASGHPDL